MAIQVVKIRDFLGHSQAVYALCNDLQENCFYSAGADGMVVSWTLDKEDGILLMRNNSAVYSIYADEENVYSGNLNGVFTIFNKTEKNIREITISNSAIFEISKWKNGLMLLNGDGHLYILNSTFELVRKIALSTKSLRCSVNLKNGCAIGASDGYLYFLDEELNLISTMKDSTLSVFALTYHFKNSTLISGGKDAMLKYYMEEKLQLSIAAHTLHIHSLSLNEDETLLLSASMDKSIKLWDTQNGNLLKVISHEKQDGHRSSVNKILWFDKNNFISCSDDRTLKCYVIQQI